MEKRILLSVNVMPTRGAVEVCWSDRIVIEGREPIEIGRPRASYLQDQKAQFIADVENPTNGGNSGDANPYIAALGW